MSYKRLSGIENYGSMNSAESQLLEISSEVELEDDKEEELEFKKRRVSAVTVLRYCELLCVWLPWYCHVSYL